MFEQQDNRFWKGDRVNFEDKGYAVKGGSSNKFAVYRRPSNTLLGYIKWHSFQYQMFPLNTHLSRFEMREIAQFCEVRTKDQLADSVARRGDRKKARHIPGPLPKSLKARLEKERLERLQQSQSAAGGGNIST